MFYLARLARLQPGTNPLRSALGTAGIRPDILI